MAQMLLVQSAPATSGPVSPFVTMKKHLALRLKQAALKAARPAQRKIVRALRHHVARVQRASSVPATNAAPRGGWFVRAWLQAVLAALWARNSVRQLSLRMFTRHSGSRFLASRDHAVRRIPSRRPRRLAASAEWFSFGAR
jgi:hypothetical protein